MFYLLEAFERFDPTAGTVLPDKPFPALPRIAGLGWDLVLRNLPTRPSIDDLASIAAVAEEKISTFFEIEAEFTHGHATDENGLIQFGDVNPDNTTWLEALTERLESTEMASVPGLGEVRACVVYATLALYHVEETLDYLAMERGKHEALVPGAPRFRRRPKLWYRTAAANELVLAMEALGEATFAEHALFVEEFNEHEQRETAERLKTLAAQSVNIEAGKMAREMVSRVAKEAAAKRHEENRAMKMQVLRWCEAHLAEFKSMDSAAAAVAGKLVPVAFRTARTWISDYRRGLRAD